VKVFPSICVVVPNRNDAVFLEETLGSLAIQAEFIDELIFIDDLSSDDSVLVAKKYLSKFKNFNIYSNDQCIGVMNTLNKGLGLSNSDYVMFLSSNDYLLNGCIKEIKNILSEVKEYPGLVSGMVYMQRLINGTTSIFLYPSPVISLKNSYYSADECITLLNKIGSWFMGITIAYRRESLLDIGGVNAEYRGLGDLIAALTISSKHGACFIPRPLGVLRMHGNGVLSNTLQDQGFIKKLKLLLETNERSHSKKLYTKKFIYKLLRRISFSAEREVTNLSHASTLMKKIRVVHNFIRLRLFDVKYFILTRFIFFNLINLKLKIKR
jgi:glycosyltransferase involved in cell wall biosynthesis